MTASCKFCSELIQAGRIIRAASAAGNGRVAEMLNTDFARLGAAVVEHLQRRHPEHLQRIAHMQMTIGGLLVNLTVSSTDEKFVAEVDTVRRRMIQLLESGPVRAADPSTPAPPSEAGEVG